MVGNVRALLLLCFCMSHRAWGDPWEWRIRKNYLPVCHAWEKHGKPQAVPVLQTTWGRWHVPLLEASSVEVPVLTCLGFSSNSIYPDPHTILSFSSAPSTCLFLILLFLFISQVLERRVELAGGFPISSLLFGGEGFLCKTVYYVRHYNAVYFMPEHFT